MYIMTEQGLIDYQAQHGEMPEWWYELKEERQRNPHGDFCGNCRDMWPCDCDDPVECCGICADVKSECRCDIFDGEF